MSSGRGFNHYYHLKKLIQVSQPMTTAAFSMGFFGYIELVRRGEIFQSVMANTAQFQVGFIDGECKGYGNGCGKISFNKLMLLEILIGKYIL
jgi:hypothetical protein